MTLNLARHPFANLRPLRRLAIALWVGGGAAILVAGVLFTAYLSRSAEKRAELGRLEESSAQEAQRISGLRVELERVDLGEQNSEVDYLNERIAERTFEWSRLFDDLAEVLPWDVRIHSLSPLSIAPGRRQSGAPRPAPGEAFALHLDGSARDGEALLRFVDRLFAHPAFGDPNLEQERRNGAESQFSLTVTYRPRRDGVPSPVLAEAGASPAGAAGAPLDAPAGAAAPPASGAAAPSAAAVTEVAPPPGDGRSLGQVSPQPASPGAATTSEASSEAPGWPGVLGGSATTAQPPAPVIAAPYLQPPLPLQPAVSSTSEIR